MMVVMSNAMRQQLIAIAQNYHLNIPTPIGSPCGSYATLDEVTQMLHALKPLAPKAKPIQQMISKLTEVSYQLDPIVPCD